MGERSGLHCKRHEKWCLSGTCDDCTAMTAAEASKPRHQLPEVETAMMRNPHATGPVGVPPLGVAPLNETAWAAEMMRPLECDEDSAARQLDIFRSVPGPIFALRFKDDVVGHFINRLFAQDRLWSSEAAAELVVEMAKREESRVKTLARIVGLLDPSPQIDLVPK